MAFRPSFTAGLAFTDLWNCKVKSLPIYYLSYDSYIWEGSASYENYCKKCYTQIQRSFLNSRIFHLYFTIRLIQIIDIKIFYNIIFLKKNYKVLLCNLFINTIKCFIEKYIYSFIVLVSYICRIFLYEN